MHEETVYEALTAAHGDEGHWVFGTGFDEPLAGVDTTVPDGIDPADLGVYCLMLGDDALVLSQRLTEWITNAPELEEEVAIGNIALDLLGQARLLLARAGSVGAIGRSREPGRATDTIPDEDALAYFRDADEFRCAPLVTAADTDFGHLMVRLLVATAVRLAVFARLRDSRDPVVAAIAAKGVHELSYAPRSRRPLGAAAGRRDAGVAPSRAGCRRRRPAADRRVVHRHGRRTAARRCRRRRRPLDGARRGARRRGGGARPRHADRSARSPPTGSPRGGSAGTDPT